MRYLFTAMLLFHLNQLVFAQTGNKLRFRSVDQAGVIRGKSGYVFQVQTINGISYGTLSAGIGLGLDYYQLRTLPLFVDLRLDMTDRKNTPFGYVDLGTNLPCVKKENSLYSRFEYKRGLYYDLGLGYSWTLKGRLALVTSLGYSVKKLTEKEIYYTGGPADEPYSTYYYTFRRYNLKAGLRF